MNRREAIAALVAIPGLTRIERADVKADDVLVFSVDEVLSLEHKERIKQTTAQIWPNHRIVVLDRVMSLKVLSHAEEARK